MTVSRQQKKGSITEQRKRQILDAALAVFATKGFAEASMAEVAQAAGVAVGTIYNYYESKCDLLLSLISAHAVTGTLTVLLQNPPKSDDLAFFSTIIQERLNVGFDSNDVLLPLFGEIQRDPELRQRYADEVLSPILKLLERYLASGIAKGTLRHLNAAVVVRCLAGMVIGLSVLRKIEGEKGILRHIPRQELVTEISRLLLQGIQAPSPLRQRQQDRQG